MDLLISSILNNTGTLPPVLIPGLVCWLVAFSLELGSCVAVPQCLSVPSPTVPQCHGTCFPFRLLPFVLHPNLSSAFSFPRMVNITPMDSRKYLYVYTIESTY